MKIGIVCYPTFGGSGVMATELGQALAAKGHTVHFITSERPVRLDRFAPNIFFHQANPKDYPLFEYLPYETALTSKIVEVARYEQLDVLHVHYAIPHASAAMMARQILAEQGIRLPFITTLHGTDITLVGQDDSYAPVVTYAINQSDAVTSVSEFLKAETLREFDVKRPIDVVYNFVDLERFKPGKNNEYRRLMTPCDEKLIIHVSNFRPVKRVEDTIRTLQLVRQHVNARLLLVGDGPERCRLERLTRDLGLTANVTFMGKLELIEEILPSACLFMLPSESESFGLSALEAMACGLPVVATRVGGLPEVVDHGVNGYLHAPGDVEAMAASIVHLFTHPADMLAFCQRAYLRSQDFALDKIVPQYEALYARVVQDQAPVLA